jgi:hypothetical protein
VCKTCSVDWDKAIFTGPTKAVDEAIRVGNALLAASQQAGRVSS